MHKLNKEEGKVGPRRCGGKEICIKRTSFPTFDGNHKKWMDFRRVFKELVKISKQVPILKLAQLRSMLPEDAKKQALRNQLKPGNYWMRSMGQAHCDFLSNEQISISQLAPRTRAQQSTARIAPPLQDGITSEATKLLPRRGFSSV